MPFQENGHVSTAILRGSIRWGLWNWKGTSLPPGAVVVPEREATGGAAGLAHQQRGPSGLKDKSRAPHHCPHKTPAEIARWTAAGLVEAEHKFRRVKGYRELPALAAKLNPGLHSQVQVA